MTLAPIIRDGVPVLVVGLTGGIATGKSTVAGMFRELGVPIVDADAIVHELLDARGAAVAPVIDAFGTGVLGPDGGIDRPALAQLVFRDESARRQLEAIVHPMVITASRERLAAAAAGDGVELVIYDAALLVETNRHAEFNRLVVVATLADVQLQRLIARDGLAPDAAGARIRSQLPIAHKAALADYVIDNSGHWNETRRQVAETWRLLRDDARLLREGRPLPIRRVQP